MTDTQSDRSSSSAPDRDGTSQPKVGSEQAGSGASPPKLKVPKENQSGDADAREALQRATAALGDDEER